MSTCNPKVKCEICGKSFSYSPSYTHMRQLAQHAIRDHNCYQVNHFTKEQLSFCDCQPVSEPDCCTGPRNMKWFQKPQCNNAQTNKTKLSGYKTTVETWKPGYAELCCTTCGFVGPPFIRKQRHKMASTLIGAYVLLSLWPFCMLPFMSSGCTTISLFCKKCGSIFGNYDRQTGCLITPPESKTGERKEEKK